MQTNKEWTKIKFKPVIQFITGDTEGFNKLCLKKAGPNTKYLCRDCDVLGKEASDSSHVCNLRYLRDMFSAYKKKNLTKSHFISCSMLFGGWTLDRTRKTSHTQ